jgi:low affinity Fe/Cu permease
MSTRFARLAARVSHLAGHYIAFMTALAIIVIWAVTGPLFGFSDTWQLVINTGTTIVTFLMVFLIQNTQNRDALATHLKLDELIRAVSEADNDMINAEEETDERMKQLKAEYEKLVQKHSALKDRLSQYETPVGAGKQAAENMKLNNQ